MKLVLGGTIRSLLINPKFLMLTRGEHMTEQSLWQQIKAVVDCDKTISMINEEVKTLELAIKTDRNKTALQETSVKEKNLAITSLQKNIQLAELDAKDLKAKEERKRSQLDFAGGQKEYMALDREINNLGKQRQALEEDIVKKLYNLDLLKQDLENFLATKDDIITALHNDIAQKQEALADLAQKLSELSERRESALKLLAPEWRVQYGRMRNNVEDPIVPVLQGCCSACYYSLSPQNLIRLKRSEILTCVNCYRFLYYEAEAPKQADSAGKAQS